MSQGHDEETRDFRWKSTEDSSHFVKRGFSRPQRNNAPGTALPFSGGIVPDALLRSVPGCPLHSEEI
jgi:hypothetical protein